jgi:hypothetical protein
MVSGVSGWLVLFSQFRCGHSGEFADARLAADELRRAEGGHQFSRSCETECKRVRSGRQHRSGPLPSSPGMTVEKFFLVVGSGCSEIHCVTIAVSRGFLWRGEETGIRHLAGHIVEHHSRSGFTP